MKLPIVHYAKWDKWDWEKQILRDLTYMYIESKNTELVKAESSMVVARWLGLGGIREMLFKAQA